MPATRVRWITRATITKRHIDGLAEGLQQAGALDFAEVEIMTVKPGEAVVVPRETFASMDGIDLSRLPETITLEHDSPMLPPQGLLVVVDDDA